MLSREDRDKVLKRYEKDLEACLDKYPYLACLLTRLYEKYMTRSDCVEQRSERENNRGNENRGNESGNGLSVGCSYVPVPEWASNR